MSGKRLTKAELFKIILVGRQMSNLCFNLSQSDQIPNDYRQTMKELYRSWDAAVAEADHARTR